MSTTTQDPGTEGVVDQAKSELGDVASNGQEKAVELKEQGRGKLGETLDRARPRWAGRRSRRRKCYARAVRSSEPGRRQRPAGRASRRIAADQVEQLGGYLERASGDQLLRDAEDFARRRPWMVAGIGLVAGLAASRFLKASSERRYGASGSTVGSNGHSYSTAPRAGGGAYVPPTRAGVVSAG